VNRIRIEKQISVYIRAFRWKLLAASYLRLYIRSKLVALNNHKPTGIGPMPKTIILLLAMLLLCGLASPVQSFDVSRDAETIITYEDQDSLNYIWWMPNDYGDHSFNVRFTPNHAPVKLKGLEIILFNMEEWGAGGEPGMKVTINRSNNGFPGAQIATFNIPYTDLYFSWSDSLVWNKIYFNQYGVQPIDFAQVEDFHIVVNVIQNFPIDTLAIFSDDGTFNATNRSGFYNGSTQKFETLLDADGIETGHNFAIHAIVEFSNTPDIEVQPMILSYGDVDLTKTLDRVLVISDSGSLQLTVSKIVSTNGQFTTNFDNQPVIIQPGANKEVTVTFAPTDLSRITGDLLILSDDPSSDTLFVPLDGTGVDPSNQRNGRQGIPTTFSWNSYPNPFNSTLQVTYSVPVATKLTMTIYDINGRPLQTIVNEVKSAGLHVAEWTATGVPAGIYLIKIEGDGISAVGKALLIK